MTKKSQLEMNISFGYSIRPLKIKLYTYEMILVNLKSITYFRYIILTKEQTTLRNCRNNYSGDIIKLKFLTDDR